MTRASPNASAPATLEMSAENSRRIRPVAIRKPGLFRPDLLIEVEAVACPTDES